MRRCLVQKREAEIELSIPLHFTILTKKNYFSCGFFLAWCAETVQLVNCVLSLHLRHLVIARPQDNRFECKPVSERLFLLLSIDPAL